MAGMGGSVLSGPDAWTAVPRRLSSIGLRGLEPSKRASVLIGPNSLVVVFGRRALSASDRSGIGIRRVVADRRVASVIELIGLRALDWGFRRSVSIGGSRRERPFSVRGGLQPRSRSCSGSAAGPRLGRLAADGLSMGGWSGSGVDSCWSRAPVSGDRPVATEVLPPGCAGPPRSRDEIWSTGGSTSRWRGSTAASPVPRFGALPRSGGDRPADGKSCSSAVVGASSDCWFGRQRLPLPRVFGDRPCRVLVDQEFDDVTPRGRGLTSDSPSDEAPLERGWIGPLVLLGLMIGETSWTRGCWLA